MNGKQQEELRMLLRMFRGQRLLGCRYDEYFLRLELDFEDFVLSIELPEYTIYVSPIIERVAWT